MFVSGMIISFERESPCGSVYVYFEAEVSGDLVETKYDFKLQDVSVVNVRTALLSIDGPVGCLPYGAVRVARLAAYLQDTPWDSTADERSERRTLARAATLFVCDSLGLSTTPTPGELDSAMDDLTDEAASRAAGALR